MKSRFVRFEKVLMQYVRDIPREEYGTFICLSKDARDMISNMSEIELDDISARIAHSMNETQFKINKEFEEKYGPSPTSRTT